MEKTDLDSLRRRLDRLEDAVVTVANILLDTQAQLAKFGLAHCLAAHLLKLEDQVAPLRSTLGRAKARAEEP